MDIKKDVFLDSTILYVEDDLEIIRSVSGVIDKIFKKVHLAYDGKEGLETFIKYQDQIDAVVTDIYMPNMTGIEMLENIKEIDYDIPIIIVSAFTDTEYLISAINSGVDGFLVKPLHMKLLLKQLEKSLKIRYYENEIKRKDEIMYQQSKLAAMGEMIGNIAHQWRQPLNSIGTLMLQLETKTDMDLLDNDDIYNTVHKTNSIISHMSKTIDDFRNFFKPNKEKVNFKLKDIFNSIVSIVTAQLSNHNIELTITSKDEIEYFGYQNELKQVILNIINNAKDAIISNKIEDGKIEVDITLIEDILKISIDDNAGGIDESIMDKIFEPYFTTKFKSQGTGIGLYMSKMIIEKNMKGSLTVKNDNDGAVFIIELPIKGSCE